MIGDMNEDGRVLSFHFTPYFKGQVIYLLIRLQSELRVHSDYLASLASYV